MEASIYENINFKQMLVYVKHIDISIDQSNGQVRGSQYRKNV